MILPILRSSSIPMYEISNGKPSQSTTLLKARLVQEKKGNTVYQERQYCNDPPNHHNPKPDKNVKENSFPWDFGWLKISSKEGKLQSSLPISFTVAGMRLPLSTLLKLNRDYKNTLPSHNKNIEVICYFLSHPLSSHLKSEIIPSHNPLTNISHIRIYLTQIPLHIQFNFYFVPIYTPSSQIGQQHLPPSPPTKEKNPTCPFSFILPF